MYRIINRALLVCSIVFSCFITTNAQRTTIYYWDFNKVYPIGGGGLDSLGTNYSYTNGTRDTVYAPYSRLGVHSARIVYQRPTGIQTTPLVATRRDSILDDGNGAPYCYLNDLHILGNDTSSNQANNDFVRSRNPDENSWMYLYMPTTGYKSVVLNYAISASSTKGAFYNILSYSTNGGATWNNLTTAMDTFNISGVRKPDTLQVINPTTGGSNWQLKTINFSSDPSVNNNANFVLRWQFEGTGSNGTSGNDRYDNFSLAGDSMCAFFTVNPVNVSSCPNGGYAQFIVSVSGGTPPYSLQWQVDSGSGWLNLSNSPPYSGVNTDTLTITGTNSSMSGYQYRCEILGTCGGNSPSTSAIINFDAPLNDSIVGINQNDSIITYCTPTSATVGAHGGTSPYTYLWEPGGQTTQTATGLGTNNYTITVTDALGCTATTSLFVVGDTDLVIISGTSHTNIECNATASATVTASRGVPPYTYLWSPGSQTNATATGLSAGTYTVTVGDSTGCSVTASVTILTNPSLRDSITGLYTQVIHYWDFNQTKPASGGGGDSLGTSHYPLPAPYTLIPSGNPRIVYSRPATIQTTPLLCTLKDSILDNGSQGAGVNDLNYLPAINAVLGNDTNSNAADNFFVRSRNPDENSYMYMYMPTNGYKNIQLNYAISASSTKGAYYNVFSYSTNGGSTWNPLTSAMDTFNTGGHRHPDSLQMINPTTAASLWYPVSINLSSDTNANNNPNLILRWTFVGTSSNGTSGNDRYDNFSVSGALSQEQCSGDNSFEAEAGVKYGLAPYTYSWSPSGGTNSTASNLSAGTYTLTVTDANGCTATSSITVTQPSSPLTASVSGSTSPLCYNSNTGTATASASGGTSPYGYRWEPSGNTNSIATGLSAGTYTLTITDLNGCTATASVTLTQPTQLRDSIISSIAATCNPGNNGTATVGVAGGTSPYTYSWSPAGGSSATASGLSGGSYTVTVTDNNGCTTTASTTISQPVAIRDSIVSVTGPQALIHFWDFNNTLPASGTGGDSLGTAAYPLPAQYTQVPASNPRIIYSRPNAHQTLPLNCTLKDSILDNGTPGAFVNDLHILGNDSASSAAGNLFVRSRNPDENSYMYLYLPTTGYSNVQLNYAISASSSKGAFYNVFSYSTNGGSSWNTLTAAMDTFNTGGHPHPDSLQMINPTTAASNWYPVHINFSSDPTINNNPNFILRWEYEGTGSNGTSGNDRYDNISLLGDASSEVCNGSSDVSATVGVKYGTAPYTYSWAPAGGTNATASNLSAGTYTVDVTDANGCTGSATLSITQPTALSATITPVNESCSGSSNATATVNASGGTSPYTYLWSPSNKTTAAITGLSIGTYTVTVNDHNLCSVVATVTITQPAAISVTATVTAATCNTTNGTATASVTGGTSPYTYIWTPGSQTNATATGLSPGNYTVTVTDANGCAGTGTANVTSTGENATASVSTNVGCFGGSTGSATSSVTGGVSPYTYLWNPGANTNANASGLSAGTYTLTVTDNNGCTSSATLTITQPAQLKDSLVASTPTAVLHYWDFNNTVTAGGNGGDSLGTPYSYANSYTADTTLKTAPLYAPYTIIPGGARIVYIRPLAKQTTPFAAASRDSILDNGSQGSYINDLNHSNALIAAALGNDTNSNATDNLFVRSRNPDENSYMYLYIPTTGYQNIQVNYAIEESSAKGAQFNILSYSTNGGTSWNNLNRTVDTFSFGHQPTPDTLTVNGDLNWTGPYTLNFSGITAVNNNPNFVLRWSFAGSASAGSSGNDRYDNISVSGNLVQEACNGNASVELTANVAGGTAPYTYAWSPSVSTSASASNLSAGTYTVDVTDANGCTSTSSLTITQPAAIAAAPAATGVLCNGGSTGTATANATGGTSPYSYTWSNSQTNATATGLSAGNYTVTVKDFNGCTTTASVTVTQPLAIRDSIAASNSGCFNSNNGSATAGVTYGTAPYTYLWSNAQTNATATGLSAATYTVLVTDNNGCTATASTTLTQPTQLTASIGSAINNVSCNGGTNGSASAFASGGTSPYAYAWTPGGGTNSLASGLSAGTYTVTVTDFNGCTATASVSITQPAAISLTPAVIANASCNSGSNGSASVSATGGTSPYTYAWSPTGGSNSTATGLSAGTYTVIVTDNHGCSSTATVTISQPSTISLTPSVTANETCSGGSNGSASVSASGGNSPYTYLWTPSGKTTASVTGLSAGSYTVTVTDHNGCTSTASLTITQPFAIRDSLASITQPLCNGNKGSATIGVTYGTSPYTYTWTPSVSTTSSATSLSIGTYTVTVKDKNGCTGTTITFTITQPGAIRDTIVAASKVNVLCNGSSTGSATAGVKYGTSPYTYLWTPTGQTTATATGLSAGTYSVTVTDSHGCSGTTATVTIIQPNDLRDSVSAQTNVGCNGGNGGSATIGVKGGSSPYTYLWTPTGKTTATATGLSAGTYTVTVTDKNGCSGSSVVVTITQPATLHDSLASITYPLCNGSKGSATVGVTGGTSPYTYAWSPITNTTATATNLSAGTYTVTVKDNHNCSTTLSIIVTQPVAIRDSIVASSKVNVNCNGLSDGGATVGVKYGTSPYTYHWSPSGKTTATVSGLSAGTYTVTVTDANGCTGTAATLTITQPAAIRDSIVTQTNVGCNGGNGGSATVGVKGGASPYTYLWSPTGKTTATVTGLSAGTYTVSINDKNGCFSALIITITQPSAIRDSLANIIYPECNGGKGLAVVGVTGGTSPYTYAWSPITNTTATATNLSAGTYTVTIRDNHSCISTLIFTVTQPLAVRDSMVTADKIDVSCYGGSNGSATVGVKYGTSPYTYLWTPSGQTTAVATGLSAGTYTITVTDANGCTGTAATTTITQPASAIRDSVANMTGPLCNGGSNGSATVGVKYGASPYTYSWSPNTNTTATASNLSAGSYTISITDKNGCNSIFTFTLTQPSVVKDSIVMAATVNVSCNGGSNGSATVGATGGTSPYTYSWTPNVSTTANASGLSAGTYSVTVTDKNGCPGSTSVVTITQPYVIRDSIILLSEVGCNGGSGGSAYLGVRGGVGPYTYLWSPGGQTTYEATGLTAGTYTVTITDNNGCSGSTETVTITQPAGIRDSLASIAYPACNGSKGSATIGVSGGTSPYTYYWSPGGYTNATVTSLAAGTYTITIRDMHGCPYSYSFTMTQPSAIRDSMVTADKINVSCNGGSNGSATVGVKYGTSPYTYLWTPGGQTTATASGLSAGTYTLTVTDANGCTGTVATTTITQPSGIIRDSVSAQTNVGCNGGNGGSATIGVKGGSSPYTYLWTPTGKTTATATGLSAGTYTVTVTDKNGCSGSSVVVTITQPAGALRDTLSNLTYPLCNGSKGSATVGVTGGTSPYTYSWSPNTNTTATATNLSAGTYTITVKDNHNCSATLTITVTQPLAIRDSMVTADKINVSCNGGSNGSATVGVKYGTSPYTYLWSPSGQTTATATGLSAGVYTITVTDANGCTGTAATTTITQPAAIRDSVASMTGSIKCNGGTGVTATIGVKGGASPYTYLWTPTGKTTATQSGLSAGVYTVTVTDKNGCNNSVIVTVTQPAAIRDSVASITYPECTSTGTATIGVTGGTGPYTYLWSPSVSTTATATGLTVRDYTVTVEDHNGCSEAVVFAVTQPAALRDSIASNNCAPQSTTVGVKYGTPPYTYAWSPGGGTSATETGLSNGTYTVTVTDANGCSTTASAVVNCISIIQHPKADTCCPPGSVNDINLYPNPTTGEFTVSGLAQGQILQLYDYAGNLISNITADKADMILNISTQPNGMYLVRILDKDGTLVSQKKVVKTQ